MKKEDPMKASGGETLAGPPGQKVVNSLGKEN